MGLPSIQDVLGGTLLDSIKGIISQFHMSPEDRASLQLKLEENADAVRSAENDYNAKLNDIAGQNIRAEEQSGDKYTVRARPSVIWVGLFVIVWNYCLVPLLGHTAWFRGMTPWDLPSYFWETWGIISTGYVFLRSADKVMQAPGDSSLKLPFGIQVGQNSKSAGA